MGGHSKIIQRAAPQRNSPAAKAQKRGYLLRFPKANALLFFFFSQLCIVSWLKTILTLLSMGGRAENCLQPISSGEIRGAFHQTCNLLRSARKKTNCKTDQSSLHHISS